LNNDLSGLGSRLRPLTSALSALVAFKFFEKRACDRLFLLSSQVVLHLVSVDRLSVQTSSQIVVLSFLFIVNNHGLNLRKHMLPLTIALILSLTFMHHLHTNVIG
jgi:hypothetical protein